MKANSSGSKLENDVSNYITSRNVKLIKNKDYINQDNVLISNYPYINIYGGRGRTEFLLKKNGIVWRIECKQQEVSGSVCEKYAYIIANLHQYPEPLLLILNGKYLEKAEGILKYLRQQECEKFKVIFFNQISDII
jgi:hypothetical protein